jgi:predicted restriction endonuclease
MKCLVCHRTDVDRCHIKTKGSGGSDEPFNIMSLCRLHHALQHQIGIVTFIEKYPAVLKDVQSKGWEITRLNGVKGLRRK